MIIKVIGSIIVVLSGWLMGMYMSYKPFYRKNELSSFLLALEVLENEINNYSSLIEAFLKISERFKNKDIGSVFYNLAQRLKEKDGENIEKIWLEVLEKEKNALYINQDDIDKLKDFGKILNSYDRELEIKNINILRKYILHSIEEINSEYSKNKKMFQSVGLMGGLVIVIALI